MVDEQSIKELTERIVREFHPQKIILFGSYVSGNAGEGSDVDLLVILPFKGQAIRKSAEILKKVQPRIPVDLLVHTPDYVRKRLEWNDFFLREIMERGKTLYESSHA
jgi:predicted nucleotidyltransferase